jgi:hypothetical protein
MNTGPRRFLFAAVIIESQQRARDLYERFHFAVNGHSESGPAQAALRPLRKIKDAHRLVRRDDTSSPLGIRAFIARLFAMAMGF